MKFRVTVVLAGLALALPAQAQVRRSIAPKSMQAIAPALADYTDDVLFGDVWIRPELSPRDRSLVTLSVLIATGKSAQLAGHLNRGLSNGLKPAEVSGMVTQLAFYTGWPNAVSALSVIEEVFVERKIDMAALRAAAAVPAAKTGPRLREPNPQMTAAAPKFEELTANVIYGSLWRRPDLSPRDRSLVTIAAAAAGGDDTQLASHIRLGLTNGLTKPEIIEALTHLAFYAGWPKANSAIRIAIAAFADTGKDGADTAKPVDAAPTPKLTVTHPGKDPTAAPASNFTGSTTMTSRFESTGDAQLRGSTATFAPGAHTNWHSHPLGQVLIVTAGHGWVQADGDAVREINVGDVVWTAPNVRHWHGATRTSSMSHTAISPAKDGETATWMEPVSDVQYHGPR
ncbi:carboxymuconolactone decarboxylase family protein [Sphingomonas sp. BIUV-7]|uniref:Carboxymuconolactone decarboxylase family protein n=1 Tax=Sphingomonas natans TaxID=3063330 RepID=A0ABT8Y6X4_9SPHN|nr:carboxymuconolactone decarboxylase family protein [Sphingomonas sp. BIUV-7]MDO6414065.1 carboxymuconolactone decarboxylase family protein [Sphingomonas sp. BIUV-7]